MGRHYNMVSGCILYFSKCRLLVTGTRTEKHAGLRGTSGQSNLTSPQPQMVGNLDSGSMQNGHVAGWGR